MIDLIRKILHGHWKSLTKKYDKQCFFYCITGLRWGPLIGEISYVIRHAELNDYHPCFIVDTLGSHWVAFNILKISCTFSAIDIKNFVKDLHLHPEAEALLNSPAEHGSIFANIVNNNKVLFPSSRWNPPIYIYYPFATVLKALIHSSEYVHYQHSTTTWNETVFNERVFSTFNQQNVLPLSQKVFRFENNNWDLTIQRLYPMIYKTITAEHLPEQLLVISTRTVPYGWDHTRNTSIKSIKEILESALDYGIKCIFLAGQSPSTDILNCIQENWKNKLFDITQSSYISYNPNDEQKLRIALELFILSVVKYQCHAANGFVFIPYLLGSTIMIFDSNTITPSGPESIFVPKHTPFLSRFIDNDRKMYQGRSFLDEERIAAPRGTYASALFNLLSIRSKNDFELLRAKAVFAPELHLYERRNMYCALDAFPGNNDDKSGFKDYTAPGIIQLDCNFTARSC